VFLKVHEFYRYKQYTPAVTKSTSYLYAKSFYPITWVLDSTAILTNKDATHVQGSDIMNISKGLASYILHLTASNILFSVKYEKNLHD